MTLDLSDCGFYGPALPPPFVRFELPGLLEKLGLSTNQHGKRFERNWTALRRQLRWSGGPQSICMHVIAPLARLLGFSPPRPQQPVMTREGAEDGGWMMHGPSGFRLRCWAFASGTDLDSPSRDGRAYRFSPMRSAQRVLLASREPMALLTDGEELRLLVSDPARSGSHIAVPLLGAGGWRSCNLAPDSYRLVLALASPKGIAALSQIVEAARFSQVRVTKDLRIQARQAIEGFLQGVLSNPTNNADGKLQDCAEALWQEALIIVYRLLFIVRLECASDPARSFSFASSSIWRTVLSPNRVLAPLVRRALDQGDDTGRMLEDGLRVAFRLFRDGLSCSEVCIPSLGGALFGVETTPLLDRLVWGERGVAILLDRLLWTAPKGRARERIHYGSLDVEELGHIYEALLELEPGIAAAPMVRLRRAKLEVVVSETQAKRHRNAGGAAGRTTWVEDIRAGQFYLRAGLGRKSSGAYYTPHPFVRFLVREALAPQVAQRSPDADPDPAAILALKVVDPAIGSGHFLVEACRFLGEALYAACRMCDEGAATAEVAAVTAPAEHRARLLARAAALRRRIADLPDPDGLLGAYLPSRATEGSGGGISQSRALAICRRLVAVHCLYGVDSNPLAIELAKISLWLESYADGLPLTFLDHRLVVGDSIGGAFFSSLLTLPVTRTELDPLLARNVGARLNQALHAALREVTAIEATVGSSAADLVLKSGAKQRLDAALAPLRLLAQAWSGAVMLAQRDSDDEWLALARSVADSGTWPDVLTRRQSALLAVGRHTLPWDLVFPEVFHPDGRAGGFDVVLSNPPWDVVQPNTDEFLAGFDLSVLDAVNSRAARAVRARLLADQRVARAWSEYRDGFVRQHRLMDRLYRHQKASTDGTVMGGKLDLYRVFAERMMEITGAEGTIGMVVPSAFHANEGATAIRQLYLTQAEIKQCWSFENRNALFDIHARYRFDLIVAQRPGPTTRLNCAFYLHEFEQLGDPHRLITYDRDLIDASCNRHGTLLELRDRADLVVAQKILANKARIRDTGVILSREIHMTDDAASFESLANASHTSRREDRYLVLHEGKTIHQFCDRWDTPPRFALRIGSLGGKSVEASRYYRAACREIARSTDERTAIATLLPPGTLCGHTISVERRPMQRANATALALVAMMNSFAFDWALRQKVGVHVSIYILAGLPLPECSAKAKAFLAHGALRLCCNHAGFAPLWQEQLGNAWSETSPDHTWPAIPAEPDRWRLRAAMDAVVASGYGLSRAEYTRILGSFSHKSFPAAADLCLAAFDELARIGLGAFCHLHDPYRDVPLVAALAQPIIDLPAAPAPQRGLLHGKIHTVAPEPS
ncbi:MAG TPA: hypothetical protein VH855_22625 [Acetobacteraceae bacterium]